MRHYILNIFLIFTIPAFSQDIITTKEITETLTMLNKLRNEAGLDTVSISLALSKGCYSHAKYLIINKNNPLTAGLDGHKEFSKLKGCTKDGEIAGKSSVIHFVRPTDAIVGWMQTFYHRIPLLQPNLKEIGIGFYEEDGYTVSLIDCISGTRGENTIPVVFYPNENQNNIPLAMVPEIPDPVEQEGSYGFPITIYFTQFQAISNVTFKLSDEENKVIQCYLSTPEKPATDFSQWNSICAIPKEILRIKGKYLVTVTCLINKVPFKKIFSFETVKEE